MEIYGEFDKITGFDSMGYSPVTNTFKIIGVSLVDGRKQLKTEFYGKHETLTEFPEEISWTEDFKDLNVKSISDLDFEIKNRENRKKFSNHRRAILVLENKDVYVGLVNLDAINLINNGLKMLQVVNNDRIFYISTIKILELRFTDKRI